MDWIRLDWMRLWEVARRLWLTGVGNLLPAYRCRNGLWRRERGGLTQRRGVANRLPGGGRFLTRNCVIDAYDF